MEEIKCTHTLQPWWSGCVWGAFFGCWYLHTDSTPGMPAYLHVDSDAGGGSLWFTSERQEELQVTDLLLSVGIPLGAEHNRDISLQST